MIECTHKPKTFEQSTMKTKGPNSSH
jgi:hypothetical protein